MMMEMDKPIDDLSDRELNRHIAQAAILWLEYDTGEEGAKNRGYCQDVLDALRVESNRRGLGHARS